MDALALHEFHNGLGAHFSELSGAEVVSHYGDPLAEHAALSQTAGVIDLSFRGRLCLTGADRVRFLHGQVTNDVQKLRVGEGCYAALVTAKGRMESDLNIFCLSDELLLDFEPGLTPIVSQRLEKFIVADDVQIVDIAPLYGLVSVQGPRASEVVEALSLFSELPPKPFNFVKVSDATLGEIYATNQPRLGTSGFDLFVPTDALGAVADKLIAAAKSVGGRACGWDAFDRARLEAGIPRFGVDMDNTIIPLEAGLESRAVSFNKGCYIGQEVINRIHTIGHVNKELRGLKLERERRSPVASGKLFKDEKEVGYLTSTLSSADGSIALGYVRREANAIGTALILRTDTEEVPVKIVARPFERLL